MQGVKGLCWVEIDTLNENLQRLFSAASLYLFADRFIIVKRIPFPMWLKYYYSLPAYQVGIQGPKWREEHNWESFIFQKGQSQFERGSSLLFFLVRGYPCTYVHFCISKVLRYSCRSWQWWDLHWAFSSPRKPSALWYSVLSLEGHGGMFLETYPVLGYTAEVTSTFVIGLVLVWLVSSQSW